MQRYLHPQSRVRDLELHFARDRTRLKQTETWTNVKFAGAGCRDRERKGMGWGRRSMEAGIEIAWEGA